MSIPGSAEPLLLAQQDTGGYQIQRSLRFNSSDSVFLSRTPASAGNRKTWTWAGWVKLGAPGTVRQIFTARTSGTPYALFYIYSDDKISFADNALNAHTTAAVYRDPSAWYHVQLTVDTTDATSANRVRLWVNGTLQTWASTTAPTQNADGQINTATAHSIGSPQPYASSEYFNGYLADIHFIDGQALDPTSFGEFSATTGVWVPKQYTGTYGTNGFKLNFSNNSTAAALGTDTSGNGNTWSVNNISVTAGAGNDSLVDVPTNGSEVDTGSGGQVRGNYCTWNPLTPQWAGMTYGGGWGTLSNGNLDIATSGLSQAGRILGTFAMSSGKWYWETTVNSTDGMNLGIAALDSMPVTNGYLGTDTKSYSYWNDGRKYTNATFSTYGATYAAGDVIGIAFDADNGTLVFYKNGTSQGTAFTGLTAGPYVPGESYANRNTSTNFGQRPFAYTAPSGYKALNTANLPAPVVTKPNTVFNVVTYVGDGASTKTVSGLAFSPDLVWTKARSQAYGQNWYDIVRGGGKVLRSDITDAELTNSPEGYVSSLTSDGYVGTAGSNSAKNVNENGTSYVGWCWDAGSSTVTNTAGSITSSVRANTSAGFSIVTYTGNLSSAGVSTVGHGLGVAPSMVITKRRDGASNWCVQHISTSSASQILFLDTTDSQFNTSGNGTLSRPTSTVFSINNSTGLGVNGQTHVAYCFAPVAGYSNGFSYTGNGSADGSFVYLGFRPRLILLKCSSTTGNWTLVDTAREGYNVDNDPLYPNLSNAEGTTDLLDITSNGFKLRTTDASVNSNAATYIGFAWAESPFQYARAR